MAGNGGFVPGGGFAGNNPEEIGQQVFAFFGVLYARVFSIGWRRLFECLSLLFAITSAVLFVTHHDTLMYGRHHDSLGNLMASWPKGGVLRVEVLRMGKNGNIRQPYVAKGKSERENLRELIAVAKIQEGLKTPMSTREIPFISEEEQIKEEKRVKWVSNKLNKIAAHKKGIDSRGGYEVVGGAQETDTLIPKTRTDELKTKSTMDLGEPSTLLEELYIVLLARLSSVMETVLQLVRPEEEYILEFSEPAEYVLASPYVRSLLNITVKTVRIDITNDTCFSSLLVRLLNLRFFNYNHLIAAHVKLGAKHKFWRWFMQNVVTDEHQMFVHPSSVLRYTSAYVSMVVFSISIVGAIHFSRRICTGLAYLLIEYGGAENLTFVFLANLIPISIALMGTHKMMKGFFLDYITFYHTSLTLLIADLFVKLSFSPITQRHWPRFYYLYLFMFYAYHVRFHGENGGFATVTFFLLMLHSMIYFFHAYELPIILATR